MLINSVGWVCYLLCPSWMLHKTFLRVTFWTTVHRPLTDLGKPISIGSPLSTVICTHDLHAGGPAWDPCLRKPLWIWILRGTGWVKLDRLLLSYRHLGGYCGMHHCLQQGEVVGFSALVQGKEHGLYVMHNQIGAFFSTTQKWQRQRTGSCLVTDPSLATPWWSTSFRGLEAATGEACSFILMVASPGAVGLDVEL